MDENMNEYITTKIPKQLMQNIDDTIKNSTYTSRMELIKDAIRRRLDEINNNGGKAGGI